MVLVIVAPCITSERRGESGDRPARAHSPEPGRGRSPLRCRTSQASQAPCGGRRGLPAAGRIGCGRADDGLAGRPVPGRITNTQASRADRARFTLPPSRVAWVDYGGQLHVGDLATGSQHVVATVDASPADPMTEVGGRLCWADINKSAAPIREYDIATGKIRDLPRGNSVFAWPTASASTSCRPTPG